MKNKKEEVKKWREEKFLLASLTKIIISDDSNFLGEKL